MYSDFPYNSTVRVHLTFLHLKILQIAMIVMVTRC